MSDAWALEGATIGEGDQVANSLAARLLLIQAGVIDPADLAAIKAVTDVIPNAGAMTDISDVTDALPDAGALTSIAQDADLTALQGDVTAVKAVTDVLPDAGVLTSISDETDKIDAGVTDGLEGVYDSLASRAHEIQHHHHNCERWFETAAVPDGEDHVADAIGSGNGAFSLDAGNDDWGSWVQILGANDTPEAVGETKYDLRRIEISAAERNNVYFLQIAFGTSGAAGLSAGNYTESVFKPLSNQIDSGPVMVQNMRQDVGTKAWSRCMCPGQNTATLSLFLGIHEYPG